MIRSLALSLLLAASTDQAAAACTLARAERVGFAALVENEAAWRGRCLAVRAVWAEGGLYPSHADARRPGGLRVGIRISDGRFARFSRPVTYTAVGILRPGPLLEATEMYRRRWPTVPNGRLP